MTYDFCFHFAHASRTAQLASCLPSCILQLCGITLMIVGLWLYINQDAIKYTRLLHDNPTSPFIIFDKIPFVCLAAGFALTVVSFLGCCGACAESVCFLSFVSRWLLRILDSAVSRFSALFNLSTTATELETKLRDPNLHKIFALFITNRRKILQNRFCKKKLSWSSVSSPSHLNKTCVIRISIM